MDTQHTAPESSRHGRRFARQRTGQPLRVARDLLTVRRAFGKPIERDGVTLVPVARVVGGAGYGQGEGDYPNPESAQGRGTGSGSGGGFGVRVSPMGVFVIHGDHVSWQPAFDLNRVVLGGQVVGAIAMVVVACALRRRRR